MISLKKEEWFPNIRIDVLAGLVVGLALIPESIAFSAIAGVDPQVGLYASFCIAVTIAFFWWAYCHDYCRDRRYGIVNDYPS